MPGRAVVHPEPPDGGWGWMIVLAAFVQSALVFGVIRSFGVFFVEFVAYFDELSGRISWITSIGIAVQQFASPVGSALSSCYGARPVVMAGGFFSGLGLLLASFATCLTHLYLCIGLLSGFGWALVFTPSLASMARYFKKRRVLATSLALTGVGISSFAFSPLFQFLVDIYAWRGALLIVAGMSFNLMVCGALIRPLTLKEDVPGPARGEAGGLSWEKFSSLFGLHLLSHCPFMRFVLAITLINTGYFIPYIHLVARARELGFDEYQAAFVMSMAAVADLCGRLFSGWLGNCRACHLIHILVTWTFLTGVSLVLIPWGRSYLLLVAISLCYGFFSGALTPIVFSIIPEIVGIGNIFSSMGLLQMIESIGGLMGAPLSGWLRDATGDYVVSFLAAGSFILAGTLVLVTLPNFFSCLASPAVPEPSTKVKTGEGTPLASAPVPVVVLSPHDYHPYKVIPEIHEPLPKS
ncbi:monocarboxylate transporter 13-like [Rhineura floridana]|uniref:monocarboxylate transporter 13-like n=1 Tax=Rhineura floridana TaxID=261503 RepID=UPI002AC80078|nr:monocarboxylate transporter 13-like [Rhineura floridana]XP_061446292.1 monocarboxylate transporter 13-like [Rhineura floridana]XP_061446293.1 monocarboxylate transporter 13-like [Rhineura floridana]